MALSSTTSVDSPFVETLEKVDDVDYYSCSGVDSVDDATSLCCLSQADVAECQELDVNRSIRQPFLGTDTQTPKELQSRDGGVVCLARWVRERTQQSWSWGTQLCRSMITRCQGRENSLCDKRVGVTTTKGYGMTRSSLTQRSRKKQKTVSRSEESNVIIFENTEQSMNFGRRR